jgi:hypothetical protein
MAAVGLAFDKKSVDDQELVARYLADQLSQAERDSFEAYYLEHPEVLQELNRTAKFKAGLMDLQQSGELARLISQPARRTHRLAMALAAAGAFVILGAGVWWARHVAQPMLAASAAALTPRFAAHLPVIDSYELQRTRTSSYDATIELPNTPAAIELRIRPSVRAVPARYRVTLAPLTESSGEFAELGALDPASDGFVTIYLDGSKLSPTIYEIKLVGEGANDGAANEASVFLVEVVRNTRS